MIFHIFSKITILGFLAIVLACTLVLLYNPSEKNEDFPTWVLLMAAACIISF